VPAALQIVNFRPQADADLEEFAALNERFQREVAPQLPGLERREASVDKDGLWTLVLRYASMEEATVPPGGHGPEIADQFMSKIDKSTMHVSFSTIVSE
jgi:hypothetical protein